MTITGISIDYFSTPTGQVVRVTQGQPCCRATNPHCGDRRPVMELTGCEKCGHSAGCHA